jgi:hypothetical protein
VTKPVTVDAPPTSAQIWLALRVLFGTKLAAGTVTVLTTKDDGSVTFSAYTFPQEGME